METHHLVLPGDLNHYGYLFGGRLLGWVDEACWIAASLDFPDCRFVTVAMETVVFRHSVRDGTILKIRCEIARKGTTSATYTVNVMDERHRGEPVFSTRVTFVNLDADGEKAPIP